MYLTNPNIGVEIEADTMKTKFRKQVKEIRILFWILISGIE